MARPLSKLGVEEIRQRFARADQLVSAHLLSKLRRDPRQGVRRIYEVLKQRYERERGERLRLDAMLNFERVLWQSGVRHVAGVDEVGMGPLAGPVVAAAVVFAPGTMLPGIDDSKRLDPAQRERAADAIRGTALGIGIGIAEVEEIDRINIYQAGLAAMRRAIAALPMTPDHVLIDARALPELAVPQNAFQKGDGINFSIAAASIIAKTHRDLLMIDLDRRYPGYAFARHKGYGTAEHHDAVRRLGPSPIHPQSYPAIREVCGESSARFYELRRGIEDADTPAALQSAEDEFAAAASELHDPERRRLRALLSRRWKIVDQRRAARSVEGSPHRGDEEHRAR
jgi:ribonuclease HII